MTQFSSIWDAMDGRKRMVLALATIATFVAILTMVRMATQPQLALLYSGLDPATSGEVVTQLEAQNIPFEVRGTAIYVADSLRDQTRLTMASQGLPANGAAGYELLDGLTGFGTTSQMFDATYWRAKEGELARTLVASQGVRSARVHIANPQKKPFSRETTASASIAVTMANGTLSQPEAEAMRFLVSSSVAGLAPENVTVIEATQGIVLAAGDQAAAGRMTGDAEDRAQAMKTSLERLLAARVGPGRAVVEVMIDADMDQQTITERVIDPTSRVTISSDSEEQTEQAQGTGSSAVTVASNLPDGDAGGEDSQSSRNKETLRERLNFEVSETRRERVVAPGQIRRISVAVIVDGISTTDASGTRSWEPRSEEEMTSLRALVESAMGFDAGRGDNLTIESLEFLPDTFPTDGGTSVEGAPSVLTSQLLGYLPLGILALVVLALGMFVVRPILTTPPALPAPRPEPRTIELAAEPPVPDEALAQAQLPDPDPGKITNLRSLIEDRREESGEVLRRWIEAPDAVTETT